MSPPTRPLDTAKTVVWYAILAGALQLSSVPEDWKFLPHLENTFLVQGLKNQSSSWITTQELATEELPAQSDDEEGDAFYNNVGLGPRLLAQSAVAPSSAGPAVPTDQSQVATSSTGAPTDPRQSAPLAHAEGAAPILTNGTVVQSGADPLAESVHQESASRDPLIAGRSRGVLTPLQDAWAIEQGCLEPGTTCSKRALDDFFRQLSRTARGESGAITRISHFGDSIVASDFISATVRRRMQKLYGDSGHGFVLAARPWRWYDHRGVLLSADSGWKPHSTLQSRMKDRLFGLGGVAMLASQPGVRTRVGTAADGHMGRNASRFDLYYLRQPGGGTLKASVNGGNPVMIHTDSPTQQAGFQSFTTTDGRAYLDIETTGEGPVRLFGVTLERTTPGVVYDSIGMVGGSIRSLKKIARAHWLEQLQHRQPNLIVLSFAANEELSVTMATPRLISAYEADLTTVLKTIRQAVPQCSILVMGPMDMAIRDGDGIKSRPTIPALRDAQRRVALLNGAAFWDTRAVMGGEGAMPRWVRSKAGASDLVHPSWAGAVFLGNELGRSLIETFQRWQVDPNAEPLAVATALPPPPPATVTRPGASLKPPFVASPVPHALSHDAATAPPVQGTPPVRLASEKRPSEHAPSTPQADKHTSPAATASEPTSSATNGGLAETRRTIQQPSETSSRETSSRETPSSRAEGKKLTPLEPKVERQEAADQVPLSGETPPSDPVSRPEAGVSP